VAVHGRERLAELEALALLSAGGEARALEDPCAQGAAQLARGRPAEKDRRRTLAQRGDADLRARLALEKAPLQGRQHHVLAGHLPRALGGAARMQHEQRRAAADLADE